MAEQTWFMTKLLRSLLPVSLLALLSACSDVPDEPYYQPSLAEQFDFDGNLEFEDYLQFEEAKLRRHRVFLDESNREQELAQVLPKQFDMPAACVEQPQKGVLLVHGLLDTTFALNDIGERLADACILVRSVLLPGHGTRPADLINIHRQDWIDAVDFGVETLSNDADDVYVVGFSLGGALAARAAAINPNINGVVLFAPALRMALPLLAMQSTWYRYISVWLDVDPQSMSVRYQSMPTEAIAQAWLLARDARVKLADGETFPFLAFLSADDLVIDAEGVVAELSDLPHSPQNRIMVYGESEAFETDNAEFIPVFNPSQKILNFSHVAIPYSPGNDVFGENGSEKLCGVNVGIVDEEQAAQCLENDVNWKGEFASSDNPVYLPLQRMTYNSHFDDMTQTIIGFVTSTN